MTVDADRFGYAIESILKDVSDNLDKNLTSAVKSAVRVGVQQERMYAAAYPLVITGKYIEGISSHVSRKGKNDVYGEIGNKNKPGLAHLLEKGHATIGGGRVPAYPHIAYAADEAFEKFEELALEAVDKSL